jgi:hypothetical protein
LDLSDRLRNISFIQGLVSDRNQTTVRSRNYQNFDGIAETALVEDSAIASKQERRRAEELPRLGVVTAVKWVTQVTSVTREAEGKLE